MLPRLGPNHKFWIGKPEPDTGSVMYLKNPKLYRQKVSFEVKITKNVFSGPDRETKIHLDPGSTEPVSRSVPALHFA